MQFSAFAGVYTCVAFYRTTEHRTSLWQVENRYTLLGGVIGAFITITVIQSMGALGPAKAAMLIVISQLVVAWVIELLGIFGMDKQPFEWRKLVGMVASCYWHYYIQMGEIKIL